METPSFQSSQVAKLPENPGIYKFFNGENTLIYVGKAKNIKKRVSSYFNRSAQYNRKTIRMVSEIASIQFTIVNSELDALLLENSLIKNYQPRYNILLKDDKSFPYLCITKERFPRIYATRNVDKNKADHFGPYASVKAMNNVLYLIRKLYKIRTCKYNLSAENIKKEKFKVCLEYHIGNCLGPCENLQDEQSYEKEIEQAIHIFKGNLSIPKQYFKQQMQEFASALQFEQAQIVKDKLDLLDKFQSKSLVVNQNIADVDVFSILSDEKRAYINFLKVQNGSIIHTQSMEIRKKLEESNEDILSLVIVDMREKYASKATDVLTNIPIEATLENIDITVPKIGDKRKLVDMSIKNALFFKKERYNQKLEGKDKANRVLIRLQDDLRLKALPIHIECFDNSNIQGSNPVASMVCFLNGKPAKKEYRHYNIKTVVGPDDFASMYEVTHRRYKRLLDEAASLPQLIVIDGGKGQLNAAVKALKALGVYGDIPIIGIAKRLEEIYFPEDPYPLHLDKKSESLKLIQQLRDEAHRFAITFHRQKRSKGSLVNELETIKGVGKATTDKLLQTFRSVKNIKTKSEEVLAEIIGKDKARIVYQGLHRENKKAENL